MIANLIAVAFGGALGALGRFGLNLLTTRLWGNDFPLGTLIVNLSGCLMIGMLLAGTEQRWFPAELRLFLVTGFLGGLTTFSTFSLETVSLIQNGQLPLAILNVGLNLGVGLGLVSVGIWLGKAIVNLF